MRMRSWKRFCNEEDELGRDGSMLEDFGGKIEAEALDKYKIDDSKREAFIGRGDGVEAGAQKQEIQSENVVRTLLGKNLPFV